MEPSSKQLKSRLIQLRNAIKRKYKVFKEGAEDSEILLEKQYKPILQELRKTNDSDMETGTLMPNIKTEPGSFKEDEEMMEYEDSGEDSYMPKSETLDSKSEGSQLAQEYFKNPITRDYMTLFMDPMTKSLDNIYGPYMDNNTLMLGDKPMDFDEHGNIQIGGTNYGGSEGLYELIFKKVPDKHTYNNEDLNTYKSILIATSAHKENNKYRGKIKRNSYSTKYQRVISNFFPVQGKGMAWKSLKSRDIMHWNDANELVERLEHIAMSTESGNRGHGNEILSIIEELREAGYIKGAGNSRFKALLK